VVENNVVITNHWHGISLYGVRDSRIVNNTVIDVDSERPGPPWIMVNDHKDGTPSENVVVRNNLATSFDLEGTSITSDHNVTLTGDLAAYFVDPTPPAWNLRLLASSPALDVGSAELAPALDADRIRRPQGAGFDLGAYEWHDPSVTPAAGAAGEGGTYAGGASSGGASGSGPAGGRASTGGASNGGSSGSGGTGASTSADASVGDDGGCGCRVGSSERQRAGAAWWLFTALGVGLGMRRRHLPCSRREPPAAPILTKCSPRARDAR
jgi:parallel beta-helix repeat protein